MELFMVSIFKRSFKCCNHLFDYFSFNPILAPPPTECAADRVDCGYGGITQEECEGKGCIFDSTIPETKWCFYTVAEAPARKAECTVDPSVRIDCGYPGITDKDCREKGCCYDECIPDVTWCFEKAVIERIESIVGEEKSERATKNEVNISEYGQDDNDLVINISSYRLTSDERTVLNHISLFNMIVDVNRFMRSLTLNCFFNSKRIKESNGEDVISVSVIDKDGSEMNENYGTQDVVQAIEQLRIMMMS
ncbi:hypothetical protein XELAEV_18011379mg [Xenopus laevis]|uniref:P-type domain-containing protein n=1 Tax=Xenopus laevis TaxID=8355 RepID=A0A974DKK8_XENLA|nr:hypothetical protein XELAEV_18011379mg [Xenopus laevis]